MDAAARRFKDVAGDELATRQQVSPRLAMDVGLNRRVSDGPAGWTFTMGAAYAFAPPGMPGFNRGTR